MSAKKKNPHTGHRSRMRGRYKKAGMDAMADHEVLELLLYYAIPRRDTNKIAHGILSEFGSLHNVFEADAAEIQKRCGLSENTATLLSMVAPLTKRYNSSKWGRRINFLTTKSLAEYVNSLFIGETLECFYLLCLDNQLSLICAELMEKGTLDRAELYPREIMRFVMLNNAAYVVLAHNHPSGDLTLSNTDVTATERLIKMLSDVEVGVIDHIICGGENYVSLAERRILGLKGVDGTMKEKKALAAEAKAYSKRK